MENEPVITEDITELDKGKLPELDQSPALPEVNNNKMAPPLLTREVATKIDSSFASGNQYDAISGHAVDDLSTFNPSVPALVLADEGDFAAQVNPQDDTQDILQNMVPRAVDEGNWLSVLKAMDDRYKTQFSQQSAEHLTNITELKRQLEEKLTHNQLEMQKQLSFHHSVLQDGRQQLVVEQGDDYTQDLVEKMETLSMSTDRCAAVNKFTTQQGFDRKYSVEGSIPLPELGAYHVTEARAQPSYDRKYQLDTPIMKALSLSRPVHDSGFNEECGRVKSRSIFSGTKTSYCYDAFNGGRLFTSPCTAGSLGTSGGEVSDVSSELMDMPRLVTQPISGMSDTNPPIGDETNDDVDAVSSRVEGQNEEAVVDADLVNDKENIVKVPSLNLRAITGDDGPYANGSHGNDGGFLSPTDSESPSYRVRLHDKYSRHLADMKAYYEAEIRALRGELITTREHHLTALRTSRDSDVRELDHVTLRNRCKGLEEQNKSLLARVDQLENALTETQRDCNKKQRQISRLDSEMDNAERRVTMYMEDAQKLMEEQEKLRKDYRAVQNWLSSAENQLYESRNELTDYKGRISRLELERLKLERENEQLKSKLSAQNGDWIVGHRSHAVDQRQNLSDGMARSLNQSDMSSSRSVTQSESGSRSQPMSRSFSQSVCARSIDDHFISSRDSNKSRPANRRLSMPSRANLTDENSSNRLQVPQISLTKVTPTNQVPLNDEAVNAPVARQRRVRQGIGKSPRKSLSEEFRQQSLSLDKDEDDVPDLNNRRMRLLKSYAPLDDAAFDSSSGDASTNHGSLYAGDRCVALDRATDIAHLEKQLDALTMDKRTVETALSHIPIRGSRQDRLDKEHLDQRLDDIHAALGAVRMQLKKYQVLKTTN